MTKTRVIIRELAVNLAYFLWFYAVAAFMVFYAYRDMRLVYASLLMVVPCLAMWLLRRYCAKLIGFILSHVLLVAAVVAVLSVSPAAALSASFGGLYINLFLIINYVFLAVLTIFSLRQRFTAERLPVYDTGTAVFFLVSLAILCVIGEAAGFTGLAQMMTGIAILLLAFKFLFGHLFNLDYSMEIISQNTSQPVTAILSFNNKLIVGFILFLSAVALVANGMGLSGGLLTLMLMIGRGLRVILRFLLSFMNSEPEPDEPMAGQPDTGNVSEELMLGEADPPSWFWVVLEKIAIYFTVVAIIASIIFGIVYGCYRLYILFYKPRASENGDLSESVLPDFMESVKIRFSASGGGNLPYLRRLFYRKVRRHAQRGALTLDSGDTAWDIAKKIKASEDIDALTAKYEEARYAKTPPS